MKSGPASRQSSPPCQSLPLFQVLKWDRSPGPPLWLRLDLGSSVGWWAEQQTRNQEVVRPPSLWLGHCPLLFVQNGTTPSIWPNSELYCLQHPFTFLSVNSDTFLETQLGSHLLCEALPDHLLSPSPEELLWASAKRPLSMVYLFNYGPWSRCHACPAAGW